MYNFSRILAGLLFLFGVITIDLDSWKWGILGIALYTVPLAAQFSVSTQVRVWSLWFGVFLVLQALVQHVVPASGDFRTLQPNTDMTIDVQGGLPGISGKQHITTDEKGFRTTKPIDYEANDTLRIFAMGGSTTEDIYLDDRSTWTHRLQQVLTNKLNREVEVINTGLSGTRARNHLATMKNILQYNPDILIFMIGINDWNHHISRNFSENVVHEDVSLRERHYLRKTPLGRLLIGGMESINKGSEHTEASYIGADGDDWPRLNVTHGEYYTDQRGSLSRETRHSFKPVEVYPEFKDVLERISLLCREQSLSCVFVTQANGYNEIADGEFRKGFWMTPPNEDYTLDFESMVHIASLYNNHLLGFSSRHQHTSCDIAKDMPPSYELFIDECHFNTKGAARVADLIANCLETLL